MPFQSLPSEYARILNDLNRDVLRARPVDSLQFCANWFNSRLEAERKTVLLTAQQHQQAAAAAQRPFGTSAANASIDPTAAGPGFVADASPSSPASSDAFIPPALYNLGRRTSVSAESLAPSMSKAGSGLGGIDDAEETPAKTVIPKSDSQMQRIRSSISNNLLFRNLEDDQYTDVLLAMKEVKVEPDHAVITQGDQGDYFYIVENGQLDVYIRSDASGTGRGDKKLSYGPGDSFGELALLYAQPRAATIVSTSPCTLWALDRVTFRSILMETNFRRRSMYESLLKDVSLFAGMSSAEIAKISDALEPRVYEPNEYVFKQGERGSEFFIIWEGSAEVRKKRSDGTEDTIGTLSRGDYFGELALLNNAPRAASIVAAPLPAGGSADAPPRLRVATLSEQAFTRLLGPLAGIMSRHAETHYGPTDLLGHLAPGSAPGGGGGAGGVALGGGVGPGGMSSSSSIGGPFGAGGGGGGASSSGLGGGAGGSSYPFGSTYSLSGAPAPEPLAPHEGSLRGVPASGLSSGGVPPQGQGMWLGSSPFGASPFSSGTQS
ncbi:hypothetical protein V8E36_001261 [Tilletia maclaganii]